MESQRIEKKDEPPKDEAKIISIVPEGKIEFKGESKLSEEEPNFEEEIKKITVSGAYIRDEDPSKLYQPVPYLEELKALLDKRVKTNRKKGIEVLPIHPEHIIQKGICHLHGLQITQKNTFRREEIPEFLKLPEPSQIEVLTKTFEEEQNKQEEVTDAQSTACATIAWTTPEDKKEGSVLHIREADIGKSYSFFFTVNEQGKVTHIQNINETAKDNDNSIGEVISPYIDPRASLEGPKIISIHKKLKPDETAYVLVCSVGTFGELSLTHKVELPKAPTEEMEILKKKHQEEFYTIITKCFHDARSLNHFAFLLGKFALEGNSRQSASQKNITIMASKVGKTPEISLLCEGASLEEDLSTKVSKSLEESLIPRLAKKITDKVELYIRIGNKFQACCIEHQVYLMKEILKSFKDPDQKSHQMIDSFIRTAEQHLKDSKSKSEHFQQLMECKSEISKYFSNDFKVNRKNNALISGVLKKYLTVEELLESLQSDKKPGERLKQFISLFNQKENQLKSDWDHRLIMFLQVNKVLLIR